MATCHQCGKTIVGAYVKALERFWHPEHFACGSCGQPIEEAEFFIDNGRAHHRRCAERLLMPRCAQCGQPINGRYLEDAWGRNYCGGHEAGSVPCGGCGAPVERGAAWCGHCASQAVPDEAALALLYREVASWGETLGLNGVDRGIDVSFLSLRELDRALGGRDGTRYGMTKTRTQTSLFGRRLGPIEVEGIAVAEQIPEPVCRGVLAHEMGHVWFALSGISGADRRLEEGVCEYLAHRYYGEHSVPCRDHYQRCIEENPDRIYGEGFRRVSRAISTQGFGQFLAAVRRGENAI